MIVGMAFLYWMLYGTAATAARFFRLWYFCRSCFVRRRVEKGQGKGFSGNTIKWKVSKLEDETEEETKEKKTPQYYDPVPVTYPNKAYGFSKRPKSETLLFKNATVWTNEEAGILMYLSLYLS